MNLCENMIFFLFISASMVASSSNQTVAKWETSLFYCSILITMYRIYEYITILYNITLYKCVIILIYTYTQLLFILFCHWGYALFLVFGYNKQCCNEYRWTYIFLFIYCILGKNTKKCNYWMMGSYVLIFLILTTLQADEKFY